MPYDISFILLVVELALLVPTFILLLLASREEKGRRSLLEQMTTTAKMLSRQEYFNAVESALRSATTSVKGSITGSALETGEQEESVHRIVKAIEQLAGNDSQRKGGSPAEIKYLIPKSQDRLPIAYRYRSAGAIVKFHPALLVGDLRYIIVDERLTVLGLPSETGENQPTREGYSIASEALANIFAQHFNSKWSVAADYDDYAREVLSEIKNHSPAVSTKLLSAHLLIPVEEIERLLDSLKVDPNPDEARLALSIARNGGVSEELAIM